MVTALLENYTNLSTEEITAVQHDTNFVLKYIICDTKQ
jgi:hypothetical protein